MRSVRAAVATVALPSTVVRESQPAFVPSGGDDHANLQAFLGALPAQGVARIPRQAASFLIGSSLVWAPPANATVLLKIEETIQKLASFSDTGASSGGLVIDGTNGGVTVYLEAPPHMMVIDGNQAAGATAAGLRIKGGATVVIRGGRYNNNNSTGVFCTDANTDVRCYDVEASGNASGGNGIGFVATAGAKLRTYGDCTADGNEVAGFRFNNTAAAGCVLNGRARNNVFSGNAGVGASLRSYGGRVERFSAGGPGTADGNGAGGVAVEFGGDNWDLGDLELFQGGNPNAAQSNNSGFGLALFGATRCKVGRAVLGMNSGYHVVLGRVSSPLSTAVSNAGAGITNSATTIPCAGGSLPNVWPVQGVLLIKDAFTVDVTAGSRQLTIDTGPTGANPVPGATVDGVPAIATFTGDIANGSPTVNNVSSFTGIVDGQYYNAAGVSNGTRILSHNVGANTITLDTPANATTVGVASAVSALPQTGTYIIPSGSAGTLHPLVNYPAGVTAASVAVTLGAELVIYRGVSGGSFTSCQRGMFGSVAAAHPDAAVVTQNPTSHHNQLGTIIGDSTGNWDKDPGVAFSGGSTHNTFATVDMTGVPAAVSFGEGAAGNDHNIIESLTAHNCTIEIVQHSGGANNRIDRIAARDCAAAGGGGGYLLNHDATNWPAHDNVVGSLAHKSDFLAAPTGNIRNINGAVGNYIESKLGDQLAAPSGRRYNVSRSRVPQNQTNALVSGTVYAFGGEEAIIPAGKTVTQISLWAGTTAAAGITHLWFGLVDRRNETIAGVATTDLPNSGVLAVTADTPLGTGGNAWTANTELPLALAANFRPQDDMPYAVVFCCVATTMPTLAGFAEGNILAAINKPPAISVSTGLTGRTTPVAVGTNLSAESPFGNLAYHEIVVS